ncbi:MAG: restriction endonuclease subunit S [Pseudomonadota bacterium]
MSTLQRYSSYKESGVEWLGEIPEHWEIVPGMKVYRENKRKNIGMIEDRVLSLSYGNIIVKPIEKLVGLVPESFETYQIVQTGDIIIRCMDLQNDKTSLRTGFSRNHGIITSAYLNLNVLNGHAEYLYYYLHALDLTKVIYKFGTGLRQNLSFIDFKRLAIVFPPVDEQYSIVNFLNKKSDQIDQAIRQKEQLIELLKERRQIVINEAVTRGLNPNTSMKDSGVEWIGEIPEHWTVKRGKYIFKEINERSGTGNEELLSVSHMTGVTPRSEKNVSMFMSEDYTGSKTCQKDDLVMNIMWAWMGALGISPQEGIVSSSYAVYRQHKIILSSTYIEHLLKSVKYIEHYNRVSTGLHSSRLRFYSHMFMSMKIGFPSIDEQFKIITYIEEHTSKIDAAIELQQNYITKLKEYKATLIDSVVTGKVRVA